MASVEGLQGISGTSKNVKFAMTKIAIATNSTNAVLALSKKKNKKINFTYPIPY